MKQQITEKQFTQLAPASQTYMAKWATQRGYEVHLSIGQMLEMLLEQYQRGHRVEPMIDPPQVCFANGQWVVWVGPVESQHLELCDGLWQVISALAGQANRLRAERGD